MEHFNQGDYKMSHGSGLRPRRNENLKYLTEILPCENPNFYSTSKTVMLNGIHGSLSVVIVYGPTVVHPNLKLQIHLKFNGVFQVMTLNFAWLI